MDVLVLNSHLLHGMWGQQSSDSCLNDSIIPSQHNLVTLAELAINQHDIDSGTMALNDLILQDCALEFVILSGDVLLEPLLGQTDDNSQQIRDTLTRDGGGRDNGDVGVDVHVVVVQGGIEAFLGQGSQDLGGSVLELKLGVLLLLLEGQSGGVILSGGPIIDSVDLVQGDNERGLPHLEELHRFKGLLLDAVHDIDDQNGDVTQT